MDTCEIYAYRLLSIIKLSFEILQMMMWLSCFLHYILWMDHLIPNFKKNNMDLFSFPSQNNNNNMDRWPKIRQ